MRAHSHYLCITCNGQYHRALSILPCITKEHHVSAVFVCSRIVQQKVAKRQNADFCIVFRSCFANARKHGNWRVSRYNHHCTSFSFFMGELFEKSFPTPLQKLSHKYVKNKFVSLLIDSCTLASAWAPPRPRALKKLKTSK